mmetsp:Transcript_22501/g.89353  ORF Transcript_22501/g.89353 Transcript_22501/m.89353 type:complete len:80 (-) Transcript_22501:512-751(-)
MMLPSQRIDAISVQVQGRQHGLTMWQHIIYYAWPLTVISECQASSYLKQLDHSCRVPSACPAVEIPLTRRGVSKTNTEL